MIDTDSSGLAKLRLENRQQLLDYVLYDDNTLKEELAPTIVEFSAHQAADVFYRQGAQIVDNAISKFNIDKKRLIVLFLSTDGAV